MLKISVFLLDFAVIYAAAALARQLVGRILFELRQLMNLRTSVQNCANLTAFANISCAKFIWRNLHGLQYGNKHSENTDSDTRAACVIGTHYPYQGIRFKHF